MGWWIGEPNLYLKNVSLAKLLKENWLFRVPSVHDQGSFFTQPFLKALEIQGMKIQNNGRVYQKVNISGFKYGYLAP